MSRQIQDKWKVMTVVIKQYGSPVTRTIEVVWGEAKPLHLSDMLMMGLRGGTAKRETRYAHVPKLFIVGKD